MVGSSLVGTVSSGSSVGSCVGSWVVSVGSSPLGGSWAGSVFPVGSVGVSGVSVGDCLDSMLLLGGTSYTPEVPPHPASEISKAIAKIATIFCFSCAHTPLFGILYLL